MEEKNNSASDAHPSNGSSEMHYPTFRPSILNFSPNPIVMPCNSSKPQDNSVSTSSSTSSSIRPILNNPAISTSPVIVTRKDDSVPGGYVFGSNISSRVVNADVSQGASSNLWSSATSEVDSSSTVFTTLAKAVASTKQNPNGGEEQTLLDSANKVAEDQKQAAVTLAQVNVFTGEEGEIQVFRMHCQAYVFDTDKQRWNALGASHFHLNDIPREVDGDITKAFRSRVVVRLMSTRRVIINTPVWDTMPVALVDSRSLRIGALSEDGSHLRSYLFKFPPDASASQICAALNTRKTRTTEIKNEFKHGSLAGVKRQISKDEDHVTTPSDTPSVIQSSSSLNCNAQDMTAKGAPIFRPSVLHPFKNSPPVATSADMPSCSVTFRQSALDPVVKRLRTDHANIDSQTKISSEGNSTTPQLLNVTPISTQSIVNLPITGNVSSNFVFGQNISDRVTNAGRVSSSKDDCSSDIHEEDSGEDHESTEITPCPATLADSANAVAEELRGRQVSLAYDVPNETIITGEEGECTVLKTYCRFYTFDREKQLWVERGNAYVHLNDIPFSVRSTDPSATHSSTHRLPTGPPVRSRLVVRVCKTLKLLANTPLWSGLNVAMADDRSIRLTGMCFVTAEESSETEYEKNQLIDSQFKPEFRAYLLIMRSPNEAMRLYQALLARRNITTQSDANEDEAADTEDSTPDSNSACGSNDNGMCLTSGAVDAAKQGPA